MATGTVKKVFNIPKYASDETIVSGAENQYTIIKKGYVYGVCANGSTSGSKPTFRMEINGTIVFSITGRDDNYTYGGSGIYPVDVGDIVKIHTGTFTGTNTIHFVPL